MEPDDPFATYPMGPPDLSSVTAGLMLAGRYRLEALLAHGRSVMSWRAADQVLSRPVLIHLLEPEDQRLGWVLQAARNAAIVNDPRFLRVLDAVEASGQEPWSFVVCEFAVGDSVQTLLADGALTGQQGGYIVHEVAAALAPMHAKGLFHLRISPDSVIITPNGNVKIVGFLIDAALRPEPGEDSLTWSQQQANDILALGSLLYAATTARWPVHPSEPQRPHWGLAPAPLRGLPPVAGGTDEQVWPAPHELNRQIDPELSAVTMAIMRPALGLVGPGLHTADEVADALEGVVGITGAEESLETLVREHRGLTASPTPAVRRSSSPSSPRTDPDQPTQRMPAVVPIDLGGSDEKTRTITQPTGTGGAQAGPRMVGTPPVGTPSPDSQPTTVVARTTGSTPDAPQSLPAQDQPGRLDETGARPVPATPGRPQPVPAPPRARPRPGVLGRRWVQLLVGFVVVALIVLQVRSCVARNDQSQGSGSESSAVAAGPVEIVSAFDFDPVADGGDQNENSDQAYRAADGDPSTVWRTLSYLNNPVFGGLKPGVGMVFDLGREAQVQSVSLILDNQPNGLQLMIPNDADPTASQPPMNTVGEWHEIANDPAAGLQTTLRPAEPVTTRWVMVYFTHLPAVGAGLYRSGIAEAYINR